MARTGAVCGAITGGILVIGLRYGRAGSDPKAARERVYAGIRELMDRFAKSHGMIICRDLLSGCDLTTEDGRAQFKDRDLLHSVCLPCVQCVVEILAADSPDGCSADNPA